MVDFFPVLLAAIIGYGAKYRKFDETDYLSVESGRCLRGALAVCIMLHHIAHTVNGGVMFVAFRSIGFFVTAVFFFLSGYGLQKSYLKSDNYRDKFLLKRLPKILIPYIIVSVIVWVIRAIDGRVETPLMILKNLRMGDPIVPNSWYIVCILIFYVVFYFLMLICKKRKCAMIIGAAVWYLLYAVFCIRIGYTKHWYNTTHCLIVGMLWASYEDGIIAFLKKHYVSSLICIAALFVAAFAGKTFVRVDLPFVSAIKIKGGLEIISSACFVVLLVILLLKFKAQNRVLSYLGSISLEIYLMHGILIVLWHDKAGLETKNEFIYVLITVASTVAISALLHILSHKLLKQYNKLIK